MKNTQLHYEENGSSDAPVIVFLHGFMGQAASWRPIMESLADSFRVIAFDLPGHGASLFSKSKRLKKLRDMDDTAGLLLEDLDALKISRFTLYGYSMGGRLAQHVAIASPGRIKNLILESASFGIDDPVEKEERRKRDEALMAGIRTRKAFLAFLKNWYSMPLFRTLHGTPQIMNLISEKMNHPFAEFRQALSILSVGRHSFLAGQLAKCFLPVYYFCGKQDLAYIETARQVKTWLPEMRITIFKNASHNISIQYPQEISRAIRRILI